jgi:hypothetical protein
MLSVDNDLLIDMTSDGVLSTTSQKPKNSRKQIEQLELEDSFKGFWINFGTHHRTPGVGQQDKWSVIDMNSDTCETIHWSVNWLLGNAKPVKRLENYTYDPLANFEYLRDWTVWQRGDNQVTLPEEPLSGFELEIVRESQRIVGNCKSTCAGRIEGLNCGCIADAMESLCR